MFRFALLFACLTAPPLASADDANRLAYLDECNPWYPDKDFPKLITPQWVGEDGVDAVVVLAIDDMRDTAKYEQYLRPILNRLKQIDGRAPVSIMTCEVKPDDPQLQSWLEEGLSIEVHTIDHPCPILQGSLEKAKSTYDRCIDLLNRIPGNKPVAFRTPCCDSLNTVSPRFYSEIFSGTTAEGNYLQIDSSVMNFFTSEDESIPRDLVLDENGNERFWKYKVKNLKRGEIVHNNFVNYITNYPYPYVINNTCWQFPCVAPSDWSAQHLHGVNNPQTVEDWKAALDITVHKQGVFNLVFHPHGWITTEQVVELIDHAVEKHGKKVKFLTFREAAERLNRTFAGTELRSAEPETLAAAAKLESRRSGIGPTDLRKLPESVLASIVGGSLRSELPLYREDDTHNGFFVRDRHLCWQNEDTAHLADLIYRVSFDELLAADPNKTRSEAPPRNALPGGSASGSAASDAATERQAAPARQSVQGQSRAANGLVPVGAAAIDITPDYPVRLTGYGNRTQESDGIATRIHARALVIGDSVPVTLRVTNAKQPSDRTTAADGRRSSLPSDAERDGGDQVSKTPTPAALHHAERDGYVLHHAERGGNVPLTILLTVDNCGVPDEVTEVVFARLAEKHGIVRERFAVSSTHTHSGPWLRDFAPLIFADIPAEHAPHLEQYERELVDKLVDVVGKAIEARRPATLSVGKGKAGFAKNRRALTDGQWVGFGETDEGPVDRRLPVLAAHDANGKLIAVLANYACHATTETGDFNQISGDWPGFAADMIEADHPGAVALIAIGTGADANPSPRGTHELAVQHGREVADEVNRLLADSPHLTPISPDIICSLARIDLPLGPLPSREEWEARAKQDGVPGAHARRYLAMLDAGEEIPTTIPDYPVQTWCFGDDLAMVFLGGEVVVDYAIRMNDMFDGDGLWINAYSNDVPCYIASKRILREGGYEADSSMLYYGRPTRLSPDAEDLICDTVQKLLPHDFYSEQLQTDFPAPKSPEAALTTMVTKPGLKVELVASEPLIHDPVAYDWDVNGRLWVVEMGDYPNGVGEPRRGSAGARGPSSNSPGSVAQTGSDVESSKPLPGQNVESRRDSTTGGGRIRVLTDTDGDGRYDEATTFLDGLPFPTGISHWRNGVIITAAPDVFYAEDTDGDGRADLRETLYTGFGEGNQQHRVNGLRWGLDGWLYLGNGDSGGEIAAVGQAPRPALPGASAFDGNSQRQTQPATQRGPRQSPGTRVSVRGRDIRIQPDDGRIDTVSGQTQYGRERDDFGNWFGNNNSNPIWHYVLNDAYLRRNPHATVATTHAQISEIPGAAPVYPASRTLARFNDFYAANRFTSACSTMIYRDTLLGEQFYGSSFTCEPVHNLVSRQVLERDGATFKAHRADDERDSEFLASSDNWFRPTMVRTGPDGAIYVSDMYRFVIEHPTWIPAEYQRKLNLRAGEDRGRIYRIVGEPRRGSAGARGPSSNSPGSVAQTGSDVESSKPLPGQNVESRRDSTTAARSWFVQPWNEIPTADLVERMASPSGWWRDTAHRILLHRGDSAAVEGLQRLASGHESAAVRIQALHALSSLNPNQDFAAALNDTAAEGRRHAIQLLEPSLRTADFEPPAELLRLTDDSSPIVVQQLAYSLGESSHPAAAKALAEILRRHSGKQYIVAAAMSSLNENNVAAVLNQFGDEPVAGTTSELFGQLIAQAAAMQQADAVLKPFSAMLNAVNVDSATAADWNTAADVVRQIRRFDAVNARAKASDDVRVALDRTAEVAVMTGLAIDNRDDVRAAAIRFAAATQRISDNDSRELLNLLDPQTPDAVQQAVVAAISERDDPGTSGMLLDRWNTFGPGLRSAALDAFLRRPSWTAELLAALNDKRLTSADLDAVHRERLLNHRDDAIRLAAQSALNVDADSTRTAVVEEWRTRLAQISGDAASGKAVFEKRCATCHRLQDVGKQIGADLAALKDRSTPAMLTAILDPNKAVETKFLSYTAVTVDGLSINGMLLNETGNSLTLLASDGKEHVVARTDIDELIASGRSLMPEGLEKDLSPQDLADVISFVQSSGTPWKLFDGNSPLVVTPNDDGSLTLPATVAEIYGPNLIFEQQYGNIGWWQSTDDYAVWNVQVPKSGHWTVEFDFACDNSTAGNLLRLSTGTRMLTARVPGTGTWSDYRTSTIGTIDLHAGRQQLTVTALEQPSSALIDLRAIRLIPPK